MTKSGIKVVYPIAEFGISNIMKVSEASEHYLLTQLQCDFRIV